VKKLLLSSIILFFCCSICYATIDTGVEFEARTTGSNNNGCGYDIATDGGTDYSQQDAAQLSLTDIASAGGAAISSATGGFTSAMVDNIIQLTSGTNLVPGFYEIDTYTDTNNVTLDRDPDDGTALTGDTVGAVGGGCASPDYIASDSSSSTRRIWIKNGTYNEAIDWTANSHVFVGYNSTHGDNPTGTDKPLIDAQSARANCVNINGNIDNNEFRNMRFANATADCITGNSLSTDNLFYNISIDTCGAYGVDDIGGSDIFIGNEVTGCTSGGVDTFFTSLEHCYFHDNTGAGISNSGVSAIYNFTVSESNSSHGFESGHLTIAINNIAYNNTGAVVDGFFWSDNTTGEKNTYLNNSSQDNGRYGFNQNAGGSIKLFDYNNYEGNGTAGLNNITAGSNDTTGDPLFNDPANADFSLQQGSPLIDAALSADTFSGITALKLNVGIDQTQTSAAGSSVTVGYGGLR
jgi:hypothetical protein